MAFILALDQGTTSSRAILFDRDGKIHAQAQQEFAQHFPSPGWVEHDADEIWRSQLAVARRVLNEANCPAAEVAAIGIANQRETTVAWDRSTGRPVCNAIVWQDRRTAAFCDELTRAGHGESIQQKTGLVIDAYFSGSKLRWMLDHVAGAKVLAASGRLAFGTVDTWLLWNLTGGAVHATDVSNASRTMLFNIHRLEWDQSLLDLLQIPGSCLPTVRSSSEIYGHTSAELFGGPIAIASIAGDQQAALFGQTCFEPGLAKNTYGTGCFLLMNVGGSPAVSKHRLLSTVAWQLGGSGVSRDPGRDEIRRDERNKRPTRTQAADRSTARTDYALEGSVFVGGAAVQWLRDGLGIIKSAPEIESLAASVADSGGVYFVPAFAGLGAPHWDPYARGTITGITRGTTAAHLARAAIESIAFQVADVVGAMQADSGVRIEQLRADGGAATNDLLLQFQADLLQVPVVRPTVTETTALGAAYLAGLAVGYWRDLDDVKSHWKIERTFTPTMSADEAKARRARWQRALKRSLDWETH